MWNLRRPLELLTAKQYPELCPKEVLEPCVKLACTIHTVASTTDYGVAALHVSFLKQTYKNAQPIPALKRPKYVR